jgi:hypothetical protein
VLCKHEVVGSIPSASTRSLDGAARSMRLPDSSVFTVCPIRVAPVSLSAIHHFACSLVFTKTAACGISDIVKRRSIRAWIAKHIARYALRILALSPGRSF